MATTKKKAVKKATVSKKGGKAKSAASGDRPPRTGVGAFVKAELAKKNAGTNAEIAEAAKAKFPGARTSPASVAWYRNAKNAAA